MRISIHARYDTKTIHPFISANIGRLNLRVKHKRKCEPTAKIRDAQVAKLRSNGHVLYHMNLPVPLKCVPAVTGDTGDRVIRMAIFTRFSVFGKGTNSEVLHRLGQHVGRPRC